MTDFYFPLLPDVLPPPAPGDPAWAGGDAAPDSDARYWTAQHFLDMFDRLFPSSWLDSLKSPGPGYEALQALALAMERASLAVGRAELQQFIMLATTGARARVSVQFQRNSALAGALTVKAGTVVRASKNGQRFATEQDADFGAAALATDPVRAVAEAPGYAWNVKGPVTIGATTIAGEIDAIDLPLQDPPFADSTVFVRQVADASGGLPAALEQLASERGLDRYPEEAQSAFRARVRAMVDTVSPDAVARLLAAMLDPLGQHHAYVETWQASYQTCWDAPAETIAMPDGQTFSGNLFTYDDPRPATPFRNRWLDEEEYRGCFIAVLPALPHVFDFGMAYDDVDSDDAAAHRSALGRRGYCAYDIPRSVAGAPVELLGFYDGRDVGADAVYAGAWRALQRIKAGGVVAAIEKEGQ